MKVLVVSPDDFERADKLVAAGLAVMRDPTLISGNWYIVECDPRDWKGFYGGTSEAAP